MNIARRTFLRGLGVIAALPLVKHTAFAGKLDAIQLRPLKKIRELVIGFYGPDTGTVASGAKAVMRTSAPLALRGTRLIIPSTFGEQFEVLSLKICGQEQFVQKIFNGSGEQHPRFGIPAFAFSEDAYAPNLHMDPCAPGKHIELVVRNISDNPARFAAALISDVLGPTED